MERARQFPLYPVAWSFAMSDATPTKTDKAILLRLLETEYQRAWKPASDINTYVIDGNTMFQQQVALSTIFGDLAECIYDQLPNVQRVYFVTGSYHPNSFKSSQGNQRGTPKKYLVKGPVTKIPRDWKSFLFNDENKTSLMRFLLEKDKYAPKIQGRQVLFVCQEKCVKLTTTNRETNLSEKMEELCSNHEVADIRIVLHCLLKFSQTIKQTVLFDTGTRDKKRRFCLCQTCCCRYRERHYVRLFQQCMPTRVVTVPMPL